MMKKLLSLIFILVSLPVFASRASDEAFVLVERNPISLIKKEILRNPSFYAYTRGSERENLLMAALKANREEEVIRLLLDAGVSPSARTRSKKTALMYACEYESDIKAIKTVLSYGAPLPFLKKIRILKKDKDGLTCFDYAKKNANSEEILNLLSEYAQDPSIKVAEQTKTGSVAAESDKESVEVFEENTDSIGEVDEISENYDSELPDDSEETELSNGSENQKIQEKHVQPEPDPVYAVESSPSPAVTGAVASVSSQLVSDLSVSSSSVSAAPATSSATEPVANASVSTAPVAAVVPATAAAVIAADSASKAQSAEKSSTKTSAPSAKQAKTEISAPKQNESIYLYDYAVNDSAKTAIPESLINSRTVTHKFIADANSADSNGRTPLMLAAKAGNLEMIENLLYSGAQIDSIDEDGWTALMYAVRFQGNIDVVKTLLLYGASYKAKNAYGLTPLLLATGFSTNSEIVSLLLDYYSPTSEDARYAFIYAVINAVPPTILNVFFNKKVPINVPYDGKTLLMYAAESNKDTKTIAWLLSKGASIYQLDSVSGKTAFDFAKENTRLKHDKVYWSLDPNR